MYLTSDQIVILKIGPISITATLLYTWLVMCVLVISSLLATYRLKPLVQVSRFQGFMELVVSIIRSQIAELGAKTPERYIAFIGTLFLFILVSNVLSVVPGFMPPTGSLNTSSALAACVFIAVPYYGIKERGVRQYLRNYIEPTPLMLPFNIIGELSRTLALAVRLFGNMMSGTLIVAILLSIVPLFFPVVMQLLGLVTGVIQAYIFAVLAMVYISSGLRAQEEEAIPRVSKIKTTKK